MTIARLCAVPCATTWGPSPLDALGADLLIAQHAIAPRVVIMPDGDYRPGEDYAAFVLRDLIPHLDVGQDDPLASGIRPTFRRYTGGHNRTYWRAHTAKYLVFYAAGW